MTAGPQIDISVVAPVYRGEAFIGELLSRLGPALSAITERYEIIIVDDGSTDETWTRASDAAARDPRIRGLRLSRNFGQHPAITAGIDHARGDWIVVMDSDLQDRPEDVAGLYRMAMTGEFDIVIARRKRHDVSAAKKVPSILFNWVLSRLGNIEVSQRIGNYRIFSRKVAAAFELHREQFRFFPALMARVGFRVGYHDVDREAGLQGRSSYRPLTLVRLASDAIIANSERPLRLGIYLGAILSVVAFAFAIWAALRATLHGVAVSGWASLFVALTFFAGVQILFTGLVGIYVGRVFNETKQRPLFIVAEAINFDSPPPIRSPDRNQPAWRRAGEPVQ